ncbi:MAG: zinc ribbon domain-containing protein [Methanomassiliicoccaceae archaeon]|nr:zinc ribbon domain-containing protein [Methanomassiliicoccaceae archaeon]
MICPKCQHDNPDGTLFCEECDHRTDQTYKKKTKIPPLYAGVIALAFGVSAVAFILLEFVWYLPTITGAVGMLLGSYSFTVSRLSGHKNRIMFVAVSGVALGLSAVGFMLGITGFE